MKNISRRVFIKGLAVAGVAAAASTVLAGCNTNMIPGVDDGAEDETVPTPANSHVVKDGDNTLTLSSSKLESNAYASKGKVNLYVALEVKNALGKNVVITNAAATTSDYQIVPTITLFNEDGANDGTAVLTSNDNSLYNGATGVTVVDGKTKSGYLYIESVTEKWTRLEVKFTVYKTVEKGYGSNANVSKKLDEFTFTYTK